MYSNRYRLRRKSYESSKSRRRPLLGRESSTKGNHCANSRSIPRCLLEMTFVRKLVVNNLPKARSCGTVASQGKDKAGSFLQASALRRTLHTIIRRDSFACKRQI